MKLRGIIASTLALALTTSLAFAQTNPGSSPLTIAKGGTAASTASGARTSLGVPTGTSGHALGFLDTANTWTGLQTYSATGVAFSVLSSGATANAYSNWQNGTRQWIVGVDADSACASGTATAFIFYDQTAVACRGWLSTDGGWIFGSSTTSPGAGNINLTGGAVWNNGTAPTGTGAYVRATSPALVTPALGTPSAAVLTNATGLPVSTGISGLATGIASWLATPSSANLSTSVTDETGSGALVFGTSPVLTTPNLGTPSAATLTNATGLPVSTGISGLGAGIASWLATASSANLATAVTDETGSGALVFATSPTLVTPVLGVATATSINKLTITSPATSATLTVPDGVTLTGPASSGTAMTLGNTETVTGVKTFGSSGAVGRLKIAGTTSGSTVLDATAAASGTLTLPAATDTLIAKATTDTLTNKTFDTAGTGNSFSINGVAATANTGTGAVVRATSPTLVTPALGTPASGVATNLTGLPLSGLTAQGAYTIVANNSGSSAVPTAVDVTAITAKASPVSADIVLIQDSAASNAFKRTTVGAMASAGSVASVNGQTGAVAITVHPQGRLTLQTATPVMTTTQSAKTTLYYSAYIGNQVPLYDGTNMVPTAITGGEISVATTDTTKSPAAIGASKVNDWFVWNDAGTIRLSHGPDWTSDTARSAGTALVMVNGILLNNASITNGPAASRGTYVGTTRSNASSQLDWIFGTAASGGGAAFLGVWNTYNRLNVATSVTDNGVSYTYTTGTIRQARGSAGNQISFVAGLVEEGFAADAVNFPFVVAVAGAYVRFGIGLNSTTTYASAYSSLSNNSATSTVFQALPNHSSLMPQLGVNVVSSNQTGDGANANSFNAGSTDVLTILVKM